MDDTLRALKQRQLATLMERDDEARAVPATAAAIDRLRIELGQAPSPAEIALATITAERDAALAKVAELTAQLAAHTAAPQG